MPRPGSSLALGRGLLVALGVHTLLLLGLSGSLNWRQPPPTVVAAELWAAVPQMAAPAPAELAPPLPPAPEVAPPVTAPTPAPQIVVERAKPVPPSKPKPVVAEVPKPKPTRETALSEKKRQHAAAQAQEAADREAERLEDLRLAKLREENLKRMLGQARATGDGGNNGLARQDAAPSAAYGGRLMALIRPNVLFTERLAGNPVADVEVRLAASGLVLSRRLVKSSGNPAWDDAVLRAIDRTRAFPADTDGRVPGVVILGFSQRD